MRSPGDYRLYGRFGGSASEELRFAPLPVKKSHVEIHLEHAKGRPGRVHARPQQVASAACWVLSLAGERFGHAEQPRRSMEGVFPKGYRAGPG